MTVCGRGGARTVGAARKPVGGFQFVSIVQLCMAWWAYMAGLIRLRDLRTWIACHEAVARRCTLERGRAPEYSLGELLGITGGGGGEKGLKASLGRLERAGLLTWSSSAITFAASPDALRTEDLDGFWSMLRSVPNHARRVPVPRRTLRFLAGGARPSVIATALGHLVRCLYYRNETCLPSGACKASWIATTFNQDLRRVKAARAHLIALGWLTPQETPQWEMNRDGRWFTVNLAWSRPAAVDNSPPVGEGGTVEMPPPDALSAPVLPPPESDSELPSGAKDQKPGFARPEPGVCNETTKKPQKPDLRDVKPQDLADTGRLLALYEQARTEKFVAGDGDRLRFVSAAEHARTIGTRNPCGLFVHLVRHKLWHFATNADEDAANARLKQHLFGVAKERAPEPPRRQPPALSEDARFVQGLRRAMGHRQLVGDVFTELHRLRPEWTRERWDGATAELDQAILGRRESEPSAVASLVTSLFAGAR